MNVKPEVSLQVIVCLCYIEHAGQHQLFHELNQSPVPTGASDDLMKVKISLNLPSIFLNAGLRGSTRFLEDALKLSKVAFCETSEAQLHCKQIKGIYKRMDFCVVGVCPAAHVHTARRSSLDHADLFQAVKSIPHGCPAHLKSLGQILFTEPLVGYEFPFSHSDQHLQDDPVSQRTIDRFRRKTGRVVEETHQHDSRQYTLYIRRPPKWIGRSLPRLLEFRLAIP